MRYAINRAAQLIIWNDDTFYQYYTTKLAQGKSYLNVIGHVSHKLTRVIFKLLTTNTTFKKIVNNFQSAYFQLLPVLKITLKLLLIMEIFIYKKY